MLGAERSSHSPSLGMPSSWCPIKACVYVSLPQVAPSARKGPLSSLPLAILLDREPTKVMSRGLGHRPPCQPTTQTVICCPLVGVEGTVAACLPRVGPHFCPAVWGRAESADPDLPAVRS